MNRELGEHWTIRPDATFLNHGSFGACPRPVLEKQTEWRARMEREPITFFVRDLENLLAQAREALAAFVGTAPDRLAFVPNATTGVNTVLRSVRFSPGDELLVTDHEYQACRNALDHNAAAAGAKVLVAQIPFPVTGPQQVIDAILARVTPRTRLLLVDHVTSPTALVFPIRRIVAEMASRGIETLVDGAHAPGMVPLDIDEVGAAWYTGNCHKWLCAPKGAAFLAVRADQIERVKPLPISHGWSAPLFGRTRFRVEFDWMGTLDPSAWLSVPEAIRFMGSLAPGGWPEVMGRNRALALRAREILCRALRCEPPCPEEMIGSMATLPLPPGATELPSKPPYMEELQAALFERYRIEVPVMFWPLPPRRFVRVSAQLYNRGEQYERLAAALVERLK
jgi:isopenicillin-N epimerase